MNEQDVEHILSRSMPLTAESPSHSIAQAARQTAVMSFRLQVELAARLQERIALPDQLAALVAARAVEFADERFEDATDDELGLAVSLRAVTHEAVRVTRLGMGDAQSPIAVVCRLREPVDRRLLRRLVRSPHGHLVVAFIRDTHRADEGPDGWFHTIRSSRATGVTDARVVAEGSGVSPFDAPSIEQRVGEVLD